MCQFDTSERELNQIILILDDRLLLRDFKMIKTTLEMLCDAIGPLVSPVIQSHPLLRQSRALEKCI